MCCPCVQVRAYQDTMLGHGVVRGSPLSQQGVEATSRALSKVGEVWRPYAARLGAGTGSGRVRVVGTAALRECEDAGPVATQAARLLGADLQIISCEATHHTHTAIIVTIVTIMTVAAVMIVIL